MTSVEYDCSFYLNSADMSLPNDTSSNDLSVPRHGDEYDASSSDFTFATPVSSSDSKLPSLDSRYGDEYAVESSDFAFAPPVLQVIGSAPGRRNTKRLVPIPPRDYSNETEAEKFFRVWRTELCKLGYCSNAIIDGKHVICYIGDDPSIPENIQKFLKDHDNHAVFEFSRVELI